MYNSYGMAHEVRDVEVVLNHISMKGDVDDTFHKLLFL